MQGVKNVLELELECIEEVHIQTFGSDSTRPQTAEMATVAVSPNKGSPTSCTNQLLTQSSAMII